MLNTQGADQQIRQVCEQFSVAAAAAAAGVFNRGGSSESGVIGTASALPSCSRGSCKPRFLPSPRLRPPRGAGRAGPHANSQGAGAQVHQVFLNFANRDCVSKPRGFRPQDFQKGKTPKPARRRTRARERALAASPPGPRPARLCPTRLAPFFPSEIRPLRRGAAGPPTQPPRRG